MAELAESYGLGPVSLSEIAKKEDISVAYLEQLFLALRKAGLVISSRGVHGGYVLAQSPDKISIGDILRALEGPVLLLECTGDELESSNCGRLGQCLTRAVWQRVNDGINLALNSMTLADLRTEVSK